MGVRGVMRARFSLLPHCPLAPCPQRWWGPQYILSCSLAFGSKLGESWSEQEQAGRLERAGSELEQAGRLERAGSKLGCWRELGAWGASWSELRLERPGSELEQAGRLERAWSKLE